MKALTSSGQAVLLVLLSVAVVLTVVHSSISRSVTDVIVSSKEEEALRAFSAAEAGAERALVLETNSSGPLDSATSYNAVVSSYQEGLYTYNIPDDALSGEAVSVWFVDHDAADTLTCSTGKCFNSVAPTMKVCWGRAGTSSSSSETPAAEISVFYDTSQQGVASADFADVFVARAAYDPNSSRLSSNNFSLSQGTCSIDSRNYQFSADIDFAALGIDSATCLSQQGCLLMARIRLLYNLSVPHATGVIMTGDTLPKQGDRIESTGSSGDATRKIVVIRKSPELPSIFDSVIFSPSGITK